MADGLSRGEVGGVLRKVYKGHLRGVAANLVPNGDGTKIVAAGLKMRTAPIVADRI